MQIVRQRGDGNRVTRLDLDDRNLGEVTIEGSEESGRIVVVVQATAPATRLPATYTLSLEQIN